MRRSGLLTCDTFQAEAGRLVTQESPQHNGELFVACELKQVIMLRACGLSATLSVGLEDLPLEEVDTFCEAFGITRFKSDRTVDREELDAGSSDRAESNSVDPIRHMMSNMGNGGDDIAEQPISYATASTAFTSTKPPTARLVFVGWTPTELSNAVPCQLKAVVEHLLQLQRFLQVDLFDVALWEIDDDMIERLKFIANRRSTTIFKDTFLDATEFIGDSIVQFGKEKPLAISPPKDYPTALARLYESASPDNERRLPGPSQWDQAKRDVHRFLNQQIVGPMREFAMATTNPNERNMLTRIFHLLI